VSAEHEAGHPSHDLRAGQQPRGPIEEHAGGEVRSYHGIVNVWLLVVYAILAVWAIYYLFKYWGGLGPGLAR
jgi:hypothetical protein